MGGNPSFSRLANRDFDFRFGNPPKNIDELEKEVGKDKHLGMDGIETSHLEGNEAGIGVFFLGNFWLKL